METDTRVNLEIAWKQEVDLKSLRMETLMLEITRMVSLMDLVSIFGPMVVFIKEISKMGLDMEKVYGKAQQELEKNTREII